MNAKLAFTIMAVAATFSAAAADAVNVSSPDGRICVAVDLADNGAAVYSVDFNGRTIVDESRLGIVAGEEALATTFCAVDASSVTSVDAPWTPVWGEYAQVQNRYNEMVVHLKPCADGQAAVDVRFRVYDDGVGFRYELPEQPAANYLTVTDELTEFNFADEYTLYCIPGDYDTDEYAYITTPFSQLAENMASQKHNEGHQIPGLAVQTPVMMKKGGDAPVYINIHEAALVGYPAMALDVDPDRRSFKAHLTPDKLGVRAYVQLPFNTPWRTLIIGDEGADILASQLILNLNEPCKIEDTSWIKPTKFVGVWWEMFTGGKTWAYSDKYNAKPGETDYSKLRSNGHHPANTENVKRYIDFAAEAGIPAVLVEGWNEGWEDWSGYKKNRQFSFTTPYPDFDIDEIQRYAASKGVKMIMHHETSANAADYERQLDAAFRYMKDHGYDAVKTGYVGYIIPRSEYHSSQWMVDHYLEVARRAADYRIMVDSHEAVRPTGLCRTWPNWIAQESARGGEYESFGGNTLDHHTILPFTRLKGGPMDYTPGLFQTDLSYYNAGNTSKGRTTIARQLALYVTQASPLQMACDLPENYRRFPDAFRFIQDVPVDWKDSRFIEAEPGDYVTVARLDKNSDDWYIGTVTDENARDAVVQLSFLDPGRNYTATIYEDAPDAHWDTNPQAYRITTKKVNSKTKLKLHAAPGGGAAVRITPR